MKKIIIILVLILILIIIAVIGVIYLSSSYGPVNVSAEGVVVLTDKGEYSPGDLLKIKIENNKEDKICFSSCYPYYIQRNDGKWTSYQYEECPTENIVENCVEPNNVKAFELALPAVREGMHRLLLEACAGCELRQKFTNGERLFSNNFIIK